MPYFRSPARSFSSAARCAASVLEQRQSSLVRKLERAKDVERLGEVRARLLRVAVEKRDLAEGMRESAERLDGRRGGPEPYDRFRSGARIGLFPLLCEERGRPAQRRDL